MRTFFALIVVLTLSQVWGPNAIGQSAMPTRPVTVVELSKRDYARERELTGVVSLYREEQIGFEVDGRVTTVLNEGLEVRGPAFNENGELIRTLPAKEN